jgi:hypothetical protein
MTGAHTDWRRACATAAVCLTVDDVHPTNADGPSRVGDVAREALGHLEWLLARHPLLRATLFCTADWRSLGVHSTRPTLQRIPWLRDWTYATPVLPRGTLRLDRHPQFGSYLRSLPRVDFGLHGLHHVSRGPHQIAEFHNCSRARCRRILREAMQIMADAELTVAAGVTPPAWVAPPALLDAMADLDMLFVASARDLHTPVADAARTGGSGLAGMSLIFPERLPHGRLVHVTTNFQATSSIERALAILDHRGLLTVKAHLLKRFGAYEALDGLDRPYAEFLDRLFATIEDRYGGAMWWTTMGEVAMRMRETDAPERRSA